MAQKLQDFFLDAAADSIRRAPGIFWITDEGAPLQHLWRALSSLMQGR